MNYHELILLWSIHGDLAGIAMKRTTIESGLCLYPNKHRLHIGCINSDRSTAEPAFSSPQYTPWEVVLHPTWSQHRFQAHDLWPLGSRERYGKIGDHGWLRNPAAPNGWLKSYMNSGVTVKHISTDVLGAGFRNHPLYVLKDLEISRVFHNIP